ncbi:hypothetical protein GYMLUDRAFT_179682, partial [Collybiopsis luxurians FD-317 M1]
QWRNIKELKRFRHGHDSSGIAGTMPRSLIVPCHACPHPDVNLPSGWQDAPAATSWLYTIFLAEDACFKQKACKRKHDDADPQLSPGLGVVVDPAKYFSLLNANPSNQDEISGCSSFNSIEQANSKCHKGCRSQGIGACSCARHESYLSVGDLLRDEAYLPMDYIFLSALASTSILLVMMSYNIACQWWRNFYSRMENMPEDLRLSSKCTIQFRVPKLHLVGHTDKCRPHFSFNYTPRTGVMDGEGVEHQWAWLNAAAPSLSMMRAGGRWDVLNDYCNYWNWLKTKNLRTQLSLLFCFVRAGKADA